MNQKQETNRWLMMAFGMICMLVMGICYTFSLFQPYIMEHFSVSSASASLPYTIFIAVRAVLACNSCDQCLFHGCLTPLPYDKSSRGTDFF